MSAILIAEMKKESDSLKKEAARLIGLAQRIDAVLDAYKFPNTTTNGSEVTRTPLGTVENSAPVKSSDKYSSMLQSDVVFDVLSKSKCQMSRDEIFDIAIAGGARFPSADHISPVLSRDNRFRHLGRGLWEINPDHQQSDLRESGELYTVREFIRKAGKPVSLDQIVADGLGYNGQMADGFKAKYASLRGTLNGYAKEGRFFTIESKPPESESHIIGLIEFRK